MCGLFEVVIVCGVCAESGDVVSAFKEGFVAMDWEMMDGECTQLVFTVAMVTQSVIGPVVPELCAYLFACVVVAGGDTMTLLSLLT